MTDLQRKRSSTSSTQPISIALNGHPSQWSPYDMNRSPSQSQSFSSFANKASPNSDGQSPRNPNGPARRSSYQVSASPPQPLSHIAGFESGSPIEIRNRKGSVSQQPQPIPLQPFVPFAKSDDGSSVADASVSAIRILLLENVNQTAITILKNQGYIVDTETKSLGEDELIQRLNKGGYTALGIRSKTKVTKRVIQEAGKKLLVVGCFCIGTNQVDLLTCAKAGIAVFNSPFSNSRSVAELVISEIIALSRQICDRSRELREGIWNKVSNGCWEVRGKTLGIVGYGHIGSQLSVLAEAMGMHVIYHDVMPIMPLGSANQVDDLDELLEESDFVTLHVPELPETTNMIGEAQLAKMKKGSYLINNARGKVVDLPSLSKYLKSGHLAGAAIDVFPSEPSANGPGFNASLEKTGVAPWVEALKDLPNLIMTPHIGGSTEEAQRMIGTEVGSALVRYINLGSSLGAVNFPEVSLRPILKEGSARVCHVHLNQPGVLKRVNAILGEHNVEKQFSDSKGEIAYLLADIADIGEREVEQIYEMIMKTEANVATRILI